MGRPSTYTREAADQVCALLANGESLRDICRDEDMPPESTVRGWAVDDLDGFAARYARARDIGLDCENDAMLEVARNGANDYKLISRGEGETELVPDHEHIARSRLIVDTMKWRLSKMAPKRYGDRITQEISGPNGGAIPTRIVVELVRAPSSLDSPASPPSLPSGAANRE